LLAHNITTIKWIIANEKCLLETGKPLSKINSECNKYNSSRYSNQIKNHKNNLNQSTYYKRIKECQNLINSVENIRTYRDSFKLLKIYDNQTTFQSEALDVKDRKGIDDSFILKENDVISLDPNSYYIYLIYSNRYLDYNPEMRIVKALSCGTMRHHSTLAHYGRFDAKYYEKFGIKKDVQILMGGEIITEENPYEVVISNKSGHFRPTNLAFNDYMEFISKTLGDLYKIKFVNSPYSRFAI
ncbi:hypothetical protein IB642_03535, partial [Allofrancisella guangzhouensis]